jgi:hypothetical protein
MRGLSQFRGRLAVCVASWIVGLTSIALMAQAPPVQPQRPRQRLERRHDYSWVSADRSDSDVDFWAVGPRLW